MAFTNLSDETIVGPSGHQPWKGHDGLGFVANYYWDTSTLAWVKLSGTATGPAANVTVTNFPSTYPVTQSTSPWVVSAASLPLPTGAATETSLSSLLGKYTAGTSTLTNVSASASNVTVLALNASRKSAIFYNDSSAICYLKFGATASTSSFTYQLPAAATLIVDGSPVYTGIVDGIWASATGAMRVTELT